MGKLRLDSSNPEVTCPKSLECCTCRTKAWASSCFSYSSNWAPTNTSTAKTERSRGSPWPSSQPLHGKGLCSLLGQGRSVPGRKPEQHKQLFFPKGVAACTLCCCYTWEYPGSQSLNQVGPREDNIFLTPSLYPHSCSVWLETGTLGFLR